MAAGIVKHALGVVLVLVLSTWSGINCAKLMSDKMGGKVVLQNCCKPGEMLFFHRTLQCVSWGNFNVSSWEFNPTPDFSSQFSLTGVKFPLCHENLNVTEAKDIPIEANGDIKSRGISYDPERYCIDQIVVMPSDAATELSGPTDVIVFCDWKPFQASDDFDGKYQIPKCCPLDQAYDAQKTNCVKFSSPYLPRFYDSLTGEAIKMGRDDYDVITYNESLCPRINEYLVERTEIYLIQNGDLYAPDTGRSYPPHRYCVERVLSPDRKRIDGDLAIVCMEARKTEWAHKDFCKDNVCVQKCCPEGQAIFDMKMCKNYSEPFIPMFHNSHGGRVDPPEQYNITVQPPVCDDGQPPLSFDPFREEDKLYILPTGELYSVDQGMSFKPPKYCIDTFFNDTVTAFIGSFCADIQLVEEAPAWVYILYPICMIISSMLLIITFLVYSLVPELRNLHGRTLMCYVASLLLAYILLIHSQLFSNNFSNVTCKLVATIMHFAFLSSFFWLNVMCFDIWLTFRSSKGEFWSWALGATLFIPLITPDESSMMTQTGSKAEKEKRRFKRYCLYAWGCSLIMSSIVALLDNLKDLPSWVIRPRIGYQRCWIHGDMAIFVYFYGPIAFLLVCNMIFFALTAYQLVKASMETSMVQTTKKNKQRLLLYVKLFLVMGVVWTTEVISWQVGPVEAWYVTDITNTLQGLIIFIIFVCKKKILRKVHITAKKHYQNWKCCKAKDYEPAKGNTPLRKVSASSASNWGTNTTSLPNSIQLESYSQTDSAKRPK